MQDPGKKDPGAAGTTAKERGINVTSRSVIALSLGAALSACANERPSPVSFGMGAVVVTSANAAPLEEMPAVPKKTLSDRVLAAIALERVTGLKPDPARLLQ